MIGPAGDHGALHWDFLSTFVAARRTFLSIFRRYERRVIVAARAAGVTREVLVLPPRGLARLFHQRRLETLRDLRLRPLRDLSHRLFGELSHEEMMDVYCGHIFHELSILCEEHRAVGRFLRIHDRRRYRQLFEEVSGYYPMRLRRIRRFFSAGMRRVEVLLPEWSRHRVIVRSIYLFGDRLGRQAYGEGVGAFYRLMYPQGGEVRGYLEAARSFLESGFADRAAEAAHQALAARQAARGRVQPALAEAAEQARALLEQIPAPAPSPPAVVT